MVYSRTDIEYESIQIKATYLNQTHSFCNNICNLVTMTISGRVHIIYTNICNVIISSKPNIFLGNIR